LESPLYCQSALDCSAIEEEKGVVEDVDDDDEDEKETALLYHNF
jgi:hypothetical protein